MIEMLVNLTHILLNIELFRKKEANLEEKQT
jgi:hypothetical protein